ncbi:hypothetical protein QU577_27495 [Priestia megaterium]|uniref:hypothetical protein n=1 Tax=Priestia megaterium TaxID=1404 RepID=UPI0025B22101|nr:hypothetical protein [Priestia megaterium]MDN3365490.1 hypothetical protein [Priestia megaterium]
MDSGNLWGELEGVDLEINTPKEILQEQAKFLPRLTKDLLYAEIKELEDRELYNSFDYVLDEIDEDDPNPNSNHGFAYKFLLKSRFMDTYRFELFRLHHGIGIYPVTIRLDNDIQKELQLPGTYKEIESEEDFVEFISKVLQSLRVKRVIVALMKLSR